MSVRGGGAWEARGKWAFVIPEAVACVCLAVVETTWRFHLTTLCSTVATRLLCVVCCRHRCCVHACKDPNEARARGAQGCEQWLRPGLHGDGPTLPSCKQSLPHPLLIITCFCSAAAATAAACGPFVITLRLALCVLYVRVIVFVLVECAVVSTMQCMREIE